MPSRKVFRIASRIQFLVASVLQKELSDPRIGFVTVLRVEPTEDIREAKVYYSVFGDSAVKSRTCAAIEAAAGFIQREVGKNLETRTTPQLTFILDETQEKQAHVESLIDDARLSDRADSSDEANSDEANSDEEDGSEQ